MSLSIGGAQFPVPDAGHLKPPAASGTALRCGYQPSSLPAGYQVLKRVAARSLLHVAVQMVLTGPSLSQWHRWRCLPDAP
ncbi:hypothetical protein DSL92_05530 [Billgrantia gudaonensis]|uniref:Uncharacterized protein n=1 Tax=Billgrantia gudaonensis TaxID=376427 RepID=A0A432JJU1_9GAMM|nr:hypothetical protein DSL92_05530 [Halomonas gudaonensis]